MLNYDYTPMEFVVHILGRFFNKNRQEATRIILDAHRRGSGCVAYTLTKWPRPRQPKLWTSPGSTSILCSARWKRTSP